MAGDPGRTISPPLFLRSRRLQRTGMADKLVIAGRSATAVKPDEHLSPVIVKARHFNYLVMNGNASLNFSQS